jgi:hypothetical protein
MYIVDFAIVMIFAILGVVFYLGKGAFLIAGYNTMSKEKKSKIDEKSLCKFMGKSMFVLAFGAFLMGLSDIIEQSIVDIIGLILFFSTLIFIIIYTNTKNRFMK